MHKHHNYFALFRDTIRVLDQQSLQNVRVAAELSSIRPAQPQSQWNSYSRSTNNYSRYPTYPYRGSYNQRGRGAFSSWRGQGGQRFRPPFHQPFTGNQPRDHLQDLEGY